MNMLVDVLSPANYLMINRDAVKILGLNTAVYCSELLTIYKKVVNKKKFVNDSNYFQVDRDYIEKQTSLNIDEQLKCDLNLAKSGVDVVKIDSTNPNIIYFDLERYGSILANQDIKVLESISSKVKVDNPRGSRESKSKYIIQSLKDSIECRTPKVMFALRDWIDSIFESGKGLSKIQVKKFKDSLDDYCNGDLDAALAIIDVATVHSYIDCQWAINVYESQKAKKVNTNINTRVTQQKVTTSTQLGEETF